MGSKLLICEAKTIYYYKHNLLTYTLICNRKNLKIKLELH